MAQKIKGKQVAIGVKGIRTANLNDGVLSADVAGRAKIATDYFDTATLLSKVANNALDSAVCTAKIATGAIPLSKLAENPIQVLSITDKSKFVATPTTGNDANTGLAVTGTVVTGSYVNVYVSGIMRRVANGNTDRAVSDCYFSADGGTTARSFGAVVFTDTLYWNGVVAGFNLTTTHRIDFLFLT